MPDATPSTTPTPAPAPRRPSPYLVGAGLLVIVLGFGLPQLLSDSPAPVPQSTTGDPAATPAPADLGVALLRLTAGMVVVCALCVVAARYANRKQPQPTGAMEVVATLPIGSRCVVHLVRAGDRRLLVGTDPGGVKAVVELPGPEPKPEPEIPEAFPVPEPAPEESAPVVVGPVAVPALTRDAILTLFDRLRGAPAPPSSPG